MEYLNTSTATKIFESLDTEDTIDVLERSTAEESAELLNILSKSTRLNIDRRLSYPEDAVGRLMSEVVAMLDVKTTVGDSLLELRSLHNNIAALIYVYLVNDSRELVGVVSFRELVFADENMLIEEVMIQNPISINVRTDQEEAARLIKQYELLALPVVDDSNKLIGQATVTDALDVIQQELAEDFSQSFGAGAEENIFTPIKNSCVNPGVFPFWIKFSECTSVNLYPFTSTFLKINTNGISGGIIFSCQKAIINYMV